MVDATGLPVIGAAVVEKGTMNGVSTDFNGEYTLNVKDANSIVAVSYIGYKTVELAASSSLLKALTLEEDLMSLDEVVVIGYGGVKKNDMTGSVVAIKAEDINRGAVNSPDQMLLGKVPGLMVTPATGEPGTGASIRIRGTASLNASNDPLIVIDGVPVTSNGGAGMGNPLASVNPDDIDTYTVLKDASATAIYGSRASNGVIIITTKKGRPGQLRVSYNSSYTVKQNADKIDVMSGKEYADYMLNVYDPGNDADRAAIRGLIGDIYNGNKIYNTDYQSLIYRTAFATDHNLSFSGNTQSEKMPYRVSLGANYDQGTVKGGDNTRMSLGINLAPKFLKDHLTASINIKGIYNKSNWTNGAVSDALTFDPSKPVYFYNTDGTINRSVANGYFNWGSFDSENTFVPEKNANTNPLSTLNDNVRYTTTWRSIGNIQLDYKIHGLEDLRANLNLGYDIAESAGRTYNTIGSYNNIKAGSEDTFNRYNNYSANTLLEFYLNYNKEFGIHHLDLMAGYSWQRNYVRNHSIDYFNNDRSVMRADYGIVPKEYYLVSFFGRINYSIDSRYLFTFTVREDGTSRFSSDNRWGLFPSAAFAWNLAQEKFLQDSRSLSALKLRLGWGRTGQQDIYDNYYPHIPLYNYQPNSTIPNTQYFPWVDGTIAPNYFNRGLKWETTETYNAGVDFGFFNGRINGAVDYYYRKTTDLLSEVDIPMGSNFTNRLPSNIGSMKNQGVEVSLNFVPVQTEDMNWNINLNGTWQQTRITDLGGRVINVGESMSGQGSILSGVHMEGYEPYTFRLYQQAYDANGKPIANTFVDRDGDGRITDNDRYVTGKSAVPDFFYGISTQFTYKNWDFGFNAHGQIGNYAINKVAVDNATTYRSTLSYNYLTNLTEYNFRTGFNTSLGTEQAFSDMFIENASFFRMDDINVGYTFRNVGKSNMQIRLAASVQNAFVISDFSGLDPENSDPDGVFGTIIPRPRLYTLRLNINF